MSARTSPHVTIEFAEGASRFSAAARNAVGAALVDTLTTSFPAGFNLSVVERSGVVLRAWGGYANVLTPRVETAPDTVYDLASLTKVVSTTTLALWLEDQKLWKLNQPIAEWLPDFGRRDITLRHLLTHTSGLVAHRPFFHLGRHPRAVRRAVYDEAQHGTPGTRVVYSDLNFMLLGWAIAACTNETLDRLFRRVVAVPLEMADTRYRPGARERARAAATELDGDQRLAPGLVQGEVHDGNAWSLGGVAGHAGLFSTASDLSLFAGSLLTARRHPVLSASAQSRMARYHAGRQPDKRGLGWRIEPRGWGSWPEGTLWHTGFTGTSLLVSPRADLAVVLLSNAIHPTRDLARQSDFRSVVHRAIARVNS
ncbi:MAG TPA: serine hydrolase domain-containing protein [Acidimicrobiales bacterium]